MATPESDDTVEVAELFVGRELYDFVMNEALPGSDVDPDRFWAGLSALVNDFGDRNRELLEERATMQASIDAWHSERRGQPHDHRSYRAFLEELGYLRPEGPDFVIETDRIDPEIAETPGPQLVVPATNARYALNAANARWGSLYDALYGTNALGDRPGPGPYDPERGARVIAWGRSFLDESVPLSDASHVDVVEYAVADGALVATMADGSRAGLADPTAFEGYAGTEDAPTAILLSHHGLGIELRVDRHDPIGGRDAAGVADVHLEAAVTAIVDCEDSVAAVDSTDKVLVYRNWLGLMRGDLTESVTKGDKTFTRALEPDRTYTAPTGGSVTRSGRALLLIRNVGHLMTTPAVLDGAGREAGEGLLDAMITALCAVHDIRGRGLNSSAGSMYVVKPKMHGSDEVAFTGDVFSHVESVLGLEPNTIKIGVMDEERRTTLNLKECIRAVRHRLAFINTGFLDRTGDEIHTSMAAGPMVRKGDMKTQRWITAYEQWNVDIGLACGMRGRAQIGKGMWAAPELMAEMLDQKIGHPETGANCAWVPSPTAATLHATHYHQVDVVARQAELAGGHRRASLDDLLAIPLADPTDVAGGWSDSDRQAELDNNAQGILGYVVRWVDQGVGCSTVPDIDEIGLMEDRATCRISSQHIANWLHHDVVSGDEVVETMRRMAQVVDRQNADDPNYQPMAPDYDGPAFLAALDLVLSGAEQPSGYTEPILHARRLQLKSSAGTSG